ncbi:MAG TPA: L,D-transpeptidase family protein [Chthoniobacterales bacterium]|nr:L,D-transpeptidase family protein [Chthoniobacterales bacterium]
MGGRTLIRTLCALAPLAFLASCAEYPTAPTTVAPTPPPMGYWNGDGVPGSPKIVVSISEQHAYFFKGKHLVGESTVSTGKPGFGTPPGQYTVLSKDAAHVSTVFGDYVDEFGNVVKSNIDSRKDSKPPGSHYDGARMPFAMFFRGGYAMHQGYVPPYAASHGCIRVPKEMAETFFDNAPVGTPVIVKEEAVMQSVAAPPPLPPTVPPVVSGPPTYHPPAPRMVTSTAPASVRPAIVRSTVPAPTPIPLRSPAPAPVRPATVRSTVPAPTPIPLRSPAPVPVRSPAPTTVVSQAPASVRPTPTPKSSVKSKTKHHVRSRTHRSPSPSPTPAP